MDFRIINLSLTTFTLIILFFDYFVSNIFHIGSGLLLIVSILLLLHFVRNLILRKFNTYILSLVLNISLLIFLFCSLFIHFITIFGIMFSGNNFPIILTFSLIINFVFIGVLYIETIKTAKII